MHHGKLLDMRIDQAIGGEADCPGDEKCEDKTPGGDAAGQG